MASTGSPVAEVLFVDLLGVLARQLAGLHQRRDARQLRRIAGREQLRVGLGSPQPDLRQQVRQPLRRRRTGGADRRIEVGPALDAITPAS